MASPDFSGCELKFDRAAQLHRELHERIDEFLGAEPYRFHVSHAPYGADQEEWTVTVANAKPVPREWSVLIGDCIHNARCVLDHAVYQVAAGDEKQLRQSQFPMLPSQNDKEFDRRLPGVPDPYREIVRRWQPYEMARGATGALVRLADLSNRDKHRLLNVVTLLFDHPWVGLSGSHVEAEWVNPGPVRIEDGAVAMRIRLPRSEHPETPPAGAGTRMQVMLEHPDRPLWQWQPVDSTLLTIMRAVGQILREFKLAAR